MNFKLSARVTPHVPIHILGHTSPTFSLHSHIPTINEADPITVIGVEIPRRALESHMIRTRPVRCLARLHTGQKLYEPSGHLREVEIPRSLRWIRQRRRKSRISPKGSLVTPRLSAPRKRNRT